MNKILKDRKGCSHKRKHIQMKSVRVNWKHPLVFATTDEEIQPSGGMVTECKATSYFLFHHLTLQVLECWIERSGPSFEWSTDILVEVEVNEHILHIMSTRISIIPKKKIEISKFH